MPAAAARRRWAGAVDRSGSGVRVGRGVAAHELYNPPPGPTARHDHESSCVAKSKERHTTAQLRAPPPRARAHTQHSGGARPDRASNAAGSPSRRAHGEGPQRSSGLPDYSGSPPGPESAGSMRAIHFSMPSRLDSFTCTYAHSRFRTAGRPGFGWVGFCLAPLQTWRPSYRRRPSRRSDSPPI